MNRYRRHPRIAQVTDGQRYVVSGLHGNAMVLEASAAVIWECVDGSSVDEIIHDVAARVGVDDTAIAIDVRDCLESMRRAEIVIVE